MRSLIIGWGQIGSALFDIFSRAHECLVRDIAHIDAPGVEVLHIAYPDSAEFVEGTRGYIRLYQPKLTIIHSSVAVGTTAKCGDHVVHSPERGRWPNLADEMMAFPKFIGGYDTADLELAQKYFHDCGWPAVTVPNPAVTELLKLASNVHLGLEVAWRQEVMRMFEAFGLDRYEHGYDAWEDTYNAGHTELGHKQLVRPRLSSAPIGGHCILPCTDILASQYFSKAFDFIRESNEKAKKHADRRERVA